MLSVDINDLRLDVKINNLFVICIEHILQKHDKIIDRLFTEAPIQLKKIAQNFTTGSL